MILGRWKQLINNDVQLQNQIAQARNVEDLKGICKLSEYRLFFTQSKWLEIIKCVDECLQRHQHVCFSRLFEKWALEKNCRLFEQQRTFGRGVSIIAPIYHRCFRDRKKVWTTTLLL